MLSGCSPQKLVGKTAQYSRTAGAPEYGTSVPSAAEAATWQFIARGRRKPAADPYFLLRRRCPGVRNFSSVRRFSGNLAIHCQGEAKTGGHLAIDTPALKRRTRDGAEAPYSGASGTMRQRTASQQPTFWDCSGYRRATIGRPFLGALGAPGPMNPDDYSLNSLSERSLAPGLPALPTISAPGIAPGFWILPFLRDFRFLANLKDNNNPYFCFCTKLKHDVRKRVYRESATFKFPPKP